VNWERPISAGFLRKSKETDGAPANLAAPAIYLLITYYKTFAVNALNYKYQYYLIVKNYMSRNCMKIGHRCDLGIKGLRNLGIE
jgi:hypothetical protein